MSDAPTNARRRRRGVSMATRLAATVLGVAFVSLLVATLVSVNAGQRLGTSIYEERLEAVRSSGSIDVAFRLNSLASMSRALGASPQAAAAIELFSAELNIIDAEETVSRSDAEELIALYEETYLEPLRASGENVQLRNVASENPGAVYLQFEYSRPSDTFDNPILVDDAGDGSEWTTTHTVVHPVYREVVRELDLLDVFLVDINGRVVYTAAKRPDLGTSLAIGPFSGSIVARAASAALDGPDDDVVVTDLDFYNAVPGVPVGVAASPVRDGEGGIIGAIVLTYDGRVFTDDLTAVTEVAADDENFAGADLYLIGPDGTTRSDPQPYLAAPRAFLDESVAAGVLAESERERIERNGTTILVQPAVDATYNDALEGATGITEGSSMTGTEVASSVSAVPTELVEWSTVSEIGVEAAETATQDFRNVLIVGSAIFVLLIAFAAVAWATNVMRPVRMISDRLVRRDDATPLAIPDRSPVEFHRLAASFRSMARSLRTQRSELATARADRLTTMEQMLPASVAKRIADGNVEALDEVPNATVVVIVVVGLGDLAVIEDGEPGAQRALIDRLHAEIDDLAFEHGVDRIKVVGDAYFGSCGHDRP
ncbi:MAG: hypothetical protein HRT86_17155, partial [Ilumatobacteraceae bacterium]|nr:hypothetical protein [Ilumatobacteraceae bacterium]